MNYTEARDAHYKAGVPRDQVKFFSELGGVLCPKCEASAGFSTLNEMADWNDHQNPFRCAVCQHEWNDA